MGAREKMEQFSEKSILTVDQSQRLLVFFTCFLGSIHFFLWLCMTFLVGICKETFQLLLELVRSEKQQLQNHFCFTLLIYFPNKVDISRLIMAQQSNVPEFGNWDCDGNVPYTVYFEKARNKRGSVKRNSNNPEQRMFSNNVAPVQAPPFQMDTKSGSQKGQETLRTKHVHSTSQENADLRSSSGSSLHHNTDRKVATDSSLNRRKSSSDVPKKPIQPTVGSDTRFEHSPLHPNHQTRFGGKGNGGTWERKSSTEGSNNFAPLTPGQSRLGSVTRGHETPDYSAAVPKFGDWDEANPASADGYTHVFNKVREEKLNDRAGQVPVPATPNLHFNSRNQRDNEMSKRGCCFGWFSK